MRREILSIAVLMWASGCHSVDKQSASALGPPQPGAYDRRLREAFSSTRPREFFDVLEKFYTRASNDEERRAVIYMAGRCSLFMSEPAPLLLRVGKDGTTELGLLALHQLRPFHGGWGEVQMLYIQALRSATEPTYDHMELIETASEVASVDAPYEQCLLAIIQDPAKWPVKYRTAAAESLSKYLQRVRHDTRRGQYP